VSGKRSRTKGHSFEREIARVFREYFPGSKRGFQTRGGTAEEPDVDGTPWYIECKRMKRCNINAALRQAEAALYETDEEGTRRKDARPPLAICKNDREKATVTLYLDDFMGMVNKIYGK
jgi:hypothetical protein